MLEATLKLSAEFHLVFQTENVPLVNQSFPSCRCFYSVSQCKPLTGYCWEFPQCTVLRSNPQVFINKLACVFNFGVCLPGAVSNPETHAETLNVYDLHFSYRFLYLQSVLRILFIPSPSLLPLTSSCILDVLPRGFQVCCGDLKHSCWKALEQEKINLAWGQEAWYLHLYKPELVFDRLLKLSHDICWLTQPVTQCLVELGIFTDCHSFPYNS